MVSPSTNLCDSREGTAPWAQYVLTDATMCVTTPASITSSWTVLSPFAPMSNGSPEQGEVSSANENRASAGLITPWLIVNGVVDW